MYHWLHVKMYLRRSSAINPYDYRQALTEQAADLLIGPTPGAPRTTQADGNSSVGREASCPASTDPQSRIKNRTTCAGSDLTIAKHDKDRVGTAALHSSARPARPMTSANRPSSPALTVLTTHPRRHSQVGLGVVNRQMYTCAFDSGTTNTLGQDRLGHGHRFDSLPSDESKRIQRPFNN